MSHREDETHLRDMLDYARKAVEAIRGRSRADLDHDAILGAALERFVEIVGEAANRVQDERKRAMSDVPWKQIAGMRNRLIHGYIAVDLDILWNVVHDDLPVLIERLAKELDTGA
jgi:uncharacterized protein with HEPN domain